MQENIGELEQRYQALFGDYQAGRIDEATFIAEVDQLQFRDEWGRYWMLGAQSGAWHYYDGQNWRQANPAEADKLPFLDEAGRYWQKGVKSGEWYYYDPQSGEWNKPGQDDPVAPSLTQPGQRPSPSAAPQPTFDYQTPQYSQPTVDPGAQFEAELFQDDEGRYWAMGARTGQWYFYDHEGWHPAQEFQGAGTFQPSYGYTAPSPRDSRPTQVYQSQPYQAPKNPKTQPGAAQPQSRPVAPYVPPPAMGGQPAQAYQAPGEPPLYQQPGPAPAYPYSTPPGQPQPTPPPGAPNQSGSWFYFDGKQWLKYATNEPVAEAPPDPRLILDQEAERPKAEAKAAVAVAAAKSESVVAEFFEEDEPPVEVVDVEVITVIEPEPDFEEDTPPATRSVPAKPAAGDEDVRPRRSKTSPLSPVTSTSSFGEPPRQPRSRTASTPAISSLVPQAKTPDSARSASPRRRPASQEPTVILPTGGAASGISSASARPSRPTRPVQPDPRRARDITAPMPPVTPATETAMPEPISESGRHRQVTQAMPAIAPGMASVSTARASTGQMKAAPRTKTQEKLDPAAVVQPAQELKEGYTLGDVLRSFPSTAWTFIGGLVVLLIFAFIIIGAISLVSEGDAFGIGAVSVTNPTPTLDVVPPDSTPTPGPTPSSEPDQPAATPTAVSMTTFSSPQLGFTMEYPEDWELEEEDTRVIVSPSERGLSVNTPEDTSLWIGIPDEESSTLSELLDSMLDQFPDDKDTLNEGTISIGSQTWTSTQIQFDDENLGGQGIATVAVTNKDGKGYVLVALTPAEEWNSVRPLLQGVINSFRFGAEEVVAAKASPTTSAAPSANKTPASASEAEESEAGAEAAGAAEESEAETTPTPEDTPTPEPTPTPETAATPLVYAIQPGDTLLEIASRFGVDLDLLTTENGIDNPSGLQVGQELVIPFTKEQLDAWNEGRDVPAPAGAAQATEAEEEDESAEETPAEEASAEEAEEQEADAEPPAAPREEPAAAAAPVSGRIVYPAFSPSINSFDIWMVDLATGEQTPIAGNASQPAFNRDGSLLAYRSWERSTRGIFFRDFIGGRGGIVTRFVEDGLPSWAPDGYSFVFASRKEGDRVPRVYVGNQQGENPFSVGFNGEYPAVFPDGRIVAKGCLPSGDCGMFVMGARGGGEKKISGESSDTAPAVSPDGSKIAFMSSGRGARNWEIWVMNADGSNAKRLTENGNNDGLPAWSPDGKSIAYVSDQGGVWAVWGMNADGSNQRKLFDMKGSPDGKVAHDEFNSRGWLEERITWAP